MLGLGAPELVLILIAILLLFGYKKLPDASRSLGRSLRIFKGEMKGMKDDDVRGKDAAATMPARGAVPAGDGDLTAQMHAEAAEAEARAAGARAPGRRARADRPRRV